MNLQLNGEDVDKFFRDSILQAGFSTAVQKAITDVMNGYNSPIKQALESYLKIVCRQLIEEHLGESIKQQMAAAIESQITKEMTEKVVYEAVQKMASAVDRY